MVGHQRRALFSFFIDEYEVMRSDFVFNKRSRWACFRTKRAVRQYFPRASPLRYLRHEGCRCDDEYQRRSPDGSSSGNAVPSSKAFVKAIPGRSFFTSGRNFYLIEHVTFNENAALLLIRRNRFTGS